MKKNLVLILFSLIIGQLYSQVEPTMEYMDSLYALHPNTLSIEDQNALLSAPILRMPNNLRNRSLPSVVDNSQTPYMIPIFYQAALECGQASTICYIFSYEIGVNRNYSDISYNNAYHFPSHFVWNFCNSGYNRGVCSMETWQVVRTAGTPFLPDWGTNYSSGGPTKWLSGYNKYYNAMRNRIIEMYAIPTSTEEGILTMKNWIDNHLTGDDIGGLANFYCTYYGTISNTLPAGTPEAGKKFLTGFSSSVNHSQTIVGYNDSIRWDYNGDGQYTNNIDINGDGVVNVKDWEIGGVKFCNTFGTNFGDNGYCYFSYKRLAELPAEGGIWNSCIYVVKVKDEVFPQVTYKATIKHNKRNMIKLTAGIADNASATVPQHTMEFNVFNFQGGALYMQGDTTQESYKTLELGLDVSPLLNYITPGTDAKFFFNVIEDDPNQAGSGEIVNFSVMDYTSSTVQEQACDQTNVSITNNDTTTLTITRAINFSKPDIQDSILPPMDAYTPYSHQLTATGGRQPYRWEFKQEYDMEEFSAPYPSLSGTNVSLTSSTSGYAIIPLNFEFPFFDQSYDQIVTYADGYITFRNTYNWPFLQNTVLQDKTTRMIAPFKDDLTITSVQKISNNEAITLIVSGRISNQSTSIIQYTVKLSKEGIIEIYYGNMVYSGRLGTSAISRGDARIFAETPASNTVCTNIANRNFRFTPPKKIDALTISSSGELSGITAQPFTNLTFDVTCWDNNDVFQHKTLSISSIYPDPLLITSIEVEAGGDNIINIGDTVYLSVKVKNVDTMAYNNCNLNFSIVDDNVTMTDDNEFFGYIAAGNEYTLNNAISFVVGYSTPNEHVLEFLSTITCDGFPSSGNFSFIVYASEINLTDFYISDNNDCLLDPNEVDSLFITLRNDGDDAINNISCNLRIDDPNVQVSPTSSSVISSILPEGEAVAEFLLLPSSSFIEGNTVDAILDLYVNNIYSKTIIFSIIGEKNCENFESENPGFINSTDPPWQISEAYFNSTNHSAASADIGDNGTSTMLINANIGLAGTITFYRMTSTENNYDWLSFYIDDVMQGRWSGNHPWEMISYPVSAGQHTFKWVYSKDVNTVGGLDKVFVDDICYPTSDTYLPNIAINPDIVSVSVPQYSTLDTILYFQSTTSIFLLFSNNLLSTNNNPINWASVNYPNGSINALSTKEVTLTFNANNKFVGETYEANLTCNVEDGNSLVIPISMTVLPAVSIENFNNETNCLIYPNPTSNYFIIKFDGIDYLNGKARLLDMTGKLLLQENIIDNITKIDINSFNSGMYLLQIDIQDQPVHSFKIVKY